MMIYKSPHRRDRLGLEEPETVIRRDPRRVARRMAISAKRAWLDS